MLFAGDGEGVAEFANDLDWGLSNFWRVLGHSDCFEEFKRTIDAIPFSETEFEMAECSFTPLSSISVSHAVWFFVRNRQSRQGLGRDFATPTKRLRRGMNENVSAWLSAVDGLPEVHARLRRVEVRNQPAVDFIRELDSPDTLFYCDPPYVHSTRVTTGEYLHEMTEDDHGLLLKALADIKGKFLLSGYQNHLYDCFASVNCWNRTDFEIDNKASGKKVKEKKIECVWRNY